MEKEFWNRVDGLRGKNTLEEICKKTGLKLGTVRDYRSDGKLPNLTDAGKIAQYLGCSLDYLLFGKQPENDLTEQERQLIRDYRSCETYMKIAIESTARDGAYNNREKNISGA